MKSSGEVTPFAKSAFEMVKGSMAALPSDGHASPLALLGKRWAGFRVKLRTVEWFIRCCRQTVTCGWPSDYLIFGDAPGDDMLMTAVAHEFGRRGLRSPSVGTHFFALFEGNPDVHQILPMSHRFARLLQRVGRSAIYPRYPMTSDADPTLPSPTTHLIAHMCAAAGLRGKVALRPYLHLSPEEESFGRSSNRQIAMISTGVNAIGLMRNKQWALKNFQDTARRLSALGYTIVQLGTRQDPLLIENVQDLRGRTTLRQAAAVIKNSLCYVGNVGFLMHVARAVDTRAVIVFGGREDPRMSGYSCNENLFTKIECAPCWLENRCPYEIKCMTEIKPQVVVEAVERIVQRSGICLEVDFAECP